MAYTQRGDEVVLSQTNDAIQTSATPIMENGKLLILVEAVNWYRDFKNPRLTLEDIKKLEAMYVQAFEGMQQ